MNLTYDQIIEHLQKQIGDYAKMLAVSEASIGEYKKTIKDLEDKLFKLAGNKEEEKWWKI